MSEQTNVVQGWKLRGVVYQPPHNMRRVGGTAAKASADIRRSFAVCSEAFAAALIWVGVSRIFFTYQVAYCSGNSF
jgi:hypothetical protein